MDSSNRIQVVDEGVLDALKSYSASELLRRLFPSAKIRDKGVMPSPFRDDRKPSFSCFRGRGGFYFWKDFATGESGDNVSLFRRVFPNLSYVDALDQMAWMLLGRSARMDGGASRRRDLSSERGASVPFARTLEPERESLLKVVSSVGLDSAAVPGELRDYWRGRGISDETMLRAGCRYVVFENTNRKGLVISDSNTGIPILDVDGEPMVDDGRNEAIGLRNDIGGMVLRVPGNAFGVGFKGATSSFVTTVLSGGGGIPLSVGFAGNGSNVIEQVCYDAAYRFLYINGKQGFSGIGPESLSHAVAFLESHRNMALDARDVKCFRAVLSSLQCPAAEGCVVLEGMFDGLSRMELDRIRPERGGGNDIVILNSVGNLKWCVPFVCRHDRCVLMLDNDLASGAGQKACMQLAGEIKAFGRKTGRVPAMFDGSVTFSGYKDLNEALMAGKGFPYEPAGKTSGCAVKASGAKKNRGRGI